MIRIEKPPKAPGILTTRGAAKTQKDCASYDLEPSAYHSGSKIFDFDDKIYSAGSVKNALSTAQHNKCCYCECWLYPLFRSRPYRTVEHYRPKGAVQQSLKRKVQKPGYFWLAYDWENLMLSCGPCNSQKGDLFPLKGNKDRVSDHHGSLEFEQPLIVNPAVENPRKHIRFRGETPVPTTTKGRVTMEILGLRKSDDDRKRKLDILKTLHSLVELAKHSVVTIDPNELAKACRELAHSVLPQAEFSAMAQDFLSSTTPPVANK